MPRSSDRDVDREDERAKARFARADDELADVTAVPFDT